MASTPAAAGGPGTAQWAPLWQFLWGDTSQNAAQIQQQLDLPDQALVAYTELRHRGLPCPGPLRGGGSQSLKRLASRGLRRWARAGAGDAPVARWLFRATGGAPLPFLEHKVARLLNGGGGEIEYYTKDGQLSSKVTLTQQEASPSDPDPIDTTQQQLSQQQEDAEEEQAQAAMDAAMEAHDDDSTRLPPLPPPFDMYAA